jgi:hypothetical protein
MAAQYIASVRSVNVRTGEVATESGVARSLRRRDNEPGQPDRQNPTEWFGKHAMVQVMPEFGA